jgi:hypothetical protein
MSLWRGILQRKDDEWTSSFRGLDGIEVKPKIHNENIPVFKHHGTNLVNRKELRQEEAYLKDFTPFVGKKNPEYLRQLRNEEWGGSNGTEESDFLNMIMNRQVVLAERAYLAEEELGEGFAADLFAGVFDAEKDDGEELYEGQKEDAEAFEELPLEAMLDTFKDRKVEKLLIAFQSAGSLEQKQRTYDAFKAEMTKPGRNQVSEEAFVATWGERPEDAPAVGGGGGGGFAVGATEEEQAALDAERQEAVNQEVLKEWLTYKSGMKLNNAELTRVARDFGIKGRLPNTKAIIDALIAKGKSPEDLGWEKPAWK